MIIKNYEFKKLKLDAFNFFLFYGENEGYKKEIINLLSEKKNQNKTIYFEEEILSNPENFFETILSESLFDDKKIIIIKKVTDKIKRIFDEIFERKIKDQVIVLDSNELTKKSKLRIFFEKNKEVICVPFYTDNYQTLGNLLNEYVIQKKINISRDVQNLIIDRSNGSRQHLLTELEKIFFFSKEKKIIELSDIKDLTNLGENYNISELVDYCLAKNKHKLQKIINENNFSNDETILIIRTFLSKTKRLYLLRKNVDIENDIEKTITSFKPPIFWKDKELIKQQIKIWHLDSIKKLMIEINKTELLIKKNFDNSINILLDFIYSQANSVNN